VLCILLSTSFSRSDAAEARIPSIDRAEQQRVMPG
jgi:hypothetical protein